MKLLMESSREIAQATTEMFWSDRITPAQAVSVNRVIQSLPERLLSDSEVSSAMSQLTGAGLENDEAKEVIDTRQSMYKYQSAPPSVSPPKPLDWMGKAPSSN